MESQTLAIDGWRAGLRFSACHILPEHSKCSRLHGHTYAVHVRVTGVPGPDGLVLDFTRIKDIVRGLTEELDHRMLIPENDPKLDMLDTDRSVKFRYGDKGYALPAEDTAMLPIEAVSGERLSSWLLDRFMEELGDAPNLTSVELGLDDGPGQGAWSRRELAPAKGRAAKDSGVEGTVAKGGGAEGGGE